jgi:hypothetical protein
MRVVITGGTGSIGKALTNSLLEDGHEVMIVSRTPSQYSDLFPKAVQFYEWDGKTAEGWGRIVDGADAVVNLAGAPFSAKTIFGLRLTPARKTAIRQSRLDAGAAVTEAITAAENKPRVLIQSSAIGYYGNGGEKKLREGARPGDDWISQTVVLWEESTKAVETMGVRRVIARTGLLLSTEEGDILNFMVLPFKFLIGGGPIGSGKQYYAWIHPADETAALRYLIDNENLSGAFNLTAPNPTRQGHFAKAIGRVLGLPAITPAPAFAFRLAFGEAAQLILDSQRVIPDRLEAADFEFQYPELEPALRDLLKKR